MSSDACFGSPLDIGHRTLDSFLTPTSAWRGRQGGGGKGAGRGCRKVVTKSASERTVYVHSWTAPGTRSKCDVSGARTKLARNRPAPTAKWDRDDPGGSGDVLWRHAAGAAIEKDLPPWAGQVF